MWILFRLALVAAAFAARLSGRFRGRTGVPTVVGDETVLLAQRETLNKTTNYYVGVEFEAPVWFRLHRETNRDRWFKRMGLATEIETGDDDFDKFVYAVCDHPMFAALLRRSAEARGLISELLLAGITLIEYSGSVVWCSMKRKPSEHEQSLVAHLGKALAPLREEVGERGLDHRVTAATRAVARRSTRGCLSSIASDTARSTALAARAAAPAGVSSSRAFTSSGVIRKSA